MAKELESADEATGSKIIAMIKDAHLYIVVREKTSYLFAPMFSSKDSMYKGKNLKQCVRNALAQKERIVQAESYREIYEHLVKH